MSTDDRLERLERRVAVLEGLIRQVVAAGGDRGASTEHHVPAAEHPAASAAPRAAESGRLPATPPARRAPSRPAGEADVRGTSRVSPLLSEQWLGQRGLLAVGVTFVILAAGYLLKLSFDRGWISPLVRCAGGAVAGAAIGALGWRLTGRGFRTYGAALIGLGAAVMYLSVWAAARLYQFLPPAQAVVALALVSVGLAAVALAINVEALGATAALGALFAPILIGKEAGTVNFLLLYLGAMGAALGGVAARRRWRLATFVVALAYFGIASSGVLRHADPAGLYLYGILGGAGGLFVGLREGWLETRFLSFAGGWTVLGVADGATQAHWPTLLGGLVLTAPVWWRALSADTVWPTRLPAERLKSGTTFADSLYFYLSPVLLGFALHQVWPDTFDRHPGLTPALIALPYLAAGLSAERKPFAVVGAAALGLAALLQWPGLEAVWALLVLAHLWALGDHALKRSDGRWYALATLAAALWHLLSVDLPARPPGEAAFTGAWALTLWWAMETTVALAAGLLRTDGVPSGVPQRPLLWGLAGLLLLFGVTGELIRAFDLSAVDRDTAGLAGGLAVSAWWICFAAGCFLVGFRRQVRALRLAGFFVAGLALAKVVFVDLSTLDALYRVGSAFILGVVSLAVAYAYHRNARRER
jgi:uncharacterized membrane protein